MGSLRLMGIGLAVLVVGLGSARAAQKISIAPNPIPCGGAILNMPAAPVAITLANTGTVANLNVTAIAISGANAVDFALQGLPGLPVVLAPGTSFQVAVVFTPSACAARSATLNVASNDPMSPNLTVPVSGYCGSAQIAVSAGTVAFGNQRIGLASAAQTVQVANTGLGDLHVTSIALAGANPGDFILNPGGLPGTIPPMQSATLSLQFAPTALNGRSAQVVIASDGDMGMNTTNTVALIGNGAMANLSIAPMMLDYGSQRIYAASSPKTVTITNTGSAFANVTAVAFGGADGNWFAQSSPLVLPARVPAGGALMLRVVAVPLALGAGDGTLTIVMDDPVTPSFSLPLTVTGVGSSITVTPNFADFGAVVVSTPSAPQTIALANEGTDLLAMPSLLLNGPDAANFSSTDAPRAPFTIQPGAMLSFDLVFQPVASMAFSASVDLMTDDPQARLVKIPLSGSGIMAGIAVTPMVVNFNPVPIGTTDGPKQVIITNGGGIPLSITSVTLGGTAAQAFAIDQPGPFTIDPGRMQVVNATFTPPISGPLKATLSIAPKGLPSVTVSLNGTGIAPQLGVSPAQLDFMEVAIGTDSPPQMVNLLNGSMTSVINLANIISSDSTFAVDSSATKLMLLPKEQTSFTVHFSPTGMGQKSGNIGITLAGSTIPSTMVSVIGTGTVKTSRTTPGGCSTGGGTHGWLLALLAAVFFASAAGRRWRVRP